MMRKEAKKREVEAQEAKRFDLLDYFIFGASYEMKVIYKIVRYCVKFSICLPTLALLTLATIISVSLKWPSLASAISYLLLVPALIATFIVAVWVLTRGYTRYWVGFYKLPTRIKYEDSLVIDLTGLSIKFSLPSDKDYEYKMPNTLLTMIKSGIKDPEKHYVLVSGRENRPLLTLRQLHTYEENVLELKCGTSSFSDMFFTHYFADVVIARRVSRTSSAIKWACDVFYDTDEQEKCEKHVTLRNTLSAYLNWYYQSKLTEAGFKKQSLKISQAGDLINIYRCAKNKKFSGEGPCHISLPKILPNGLGVTGVVQMQEKGGERRILLFQVREGNILDPRKLQWSFAGLIGAYDDFYERKSILSDYSDFFSIEDFIWEELYDEVLRPLNIPKNVDFKAQAVALIINAEKLYQPELIVKVWFELGKAEFKRVEKNIEPWDRGRTKSNLLYLQLLESDIGKFNEWLFSEQNLRKVRYLFPIIWTVIKSDLNTR